MFRMGEPGPEDFAAVEVVASSGLAAEDFAASADGLVDLTDDKPDFSVAESEGTVDLP